MLTNAISEAIFESSGFALAAVALIYAFLARKAGYSQLTRNIPYRTLGQLMIDHSRCVDTFSPVSGSKRGTVAIASFSPACNSRPFNTVKVNAVMPTLWNQVIGDNCLFQDNQSIP